MRRLLAILIAGGLGCAPAEAPVRKNARPPGPQEPSGSKCIGDEAVHGHAWATANDSTFAKFPPPVDSKTCLAATGCPFKPRDLPRCPVRTAGCTVPEVLAAAAELRGKRIVVRGELDTNHRGMVALMEPVCGVLSRQPLLRVRDSDPNKGFFFLTSQPNDAFTCLGDASQLCCGFPSSGSVLVAGTLAKRPVPRTDDEDLVLEDPRLCSVRSTDAG